MLTATSPGTAHLTFTCSGSTTVLTRAFATSPAKLIETKRRGGACWVYAATFGGGIVGGDDIQLRADVTNGARALVTTQASTKVYRSLRPARQSLSATVHADAFLAVVPDPVVCFAGAHFTQTQRYDLDRSATLVMVDWITSGRHASGERWAFARYESRFDIRRAARRIFFDGLVLDQNLDRVDTRMRNFDVLLTAVMTGPLVADAAAEIVNAFGREPIARDAHTVGSASRLRDGGTLLRMAGTSVEQIGRALRTQLAFITPLIGDDLWSRKW